MAIISNTFREMVEGQQSQSGEQGPRVTRVFKIACNSASDTTETVRNWADCPKYGKGLPLTLDPITYDTAWYCTDSTVTNLKSAAPQFWFLITANYALVPTGWDGSILSKVDKRGGGATTTEPIMIDRDGVPFCNTAGDMFSPLPEVPTGDQQFSLTVRTVNLTPYMGKSWKRNSDLWHGFAINSMLTGEISWLRSDAGDIPHWEVTIPLTYKEAGWNLQLVNAGFNELYEPSPGSGVFARKRIKLPDPDDGHLYEPTEPWPLGANGVALSHDLARDPANWTVGSFVTYGTAIFGAGGMVLPNPVTL